MRDDFERFKDILEAIGKIEQRNISKEAFEADEMAQVWVVHYLQIVGEAAFRMSPLTRNKFPEIPWENIIGMRHILVHGYFEIDLAVVWLVVENDLSPLKSQIEKIVNGGLI